MKSSDLINEIVSTYQKHGWELRRALLRPETSSELPAESFSLTDVVIEFAGVPIRTPEELRSRVRRAIPYLPVDVVVMRDGERLTIPVKMGKQ